MVPLTRNRLEASQVTQNSTGTQQAQTQRFKSVEPVVAASTNLFSPPLKPKLGQTNKKTDECKLKVMTDEEIK